MIEPRWQKNIAARKEARAYRRAISQIVDSFEDKKKYWKEKGITHIRVPLERKNG